MARLGDRRKEAYTDMDHWIETVRSRGYRAGNLPVALVTDSTIAQKFAQAAADADIVIAEVDVWDNLLHPDETQRDQALQRSQERLALADAVGARCCVNVSGSRAEQSGGPHPDNLTAATFDLIVETVRKLVDAVKPTRTFFTLEALPWSYPNSPDSYLDLIRAVDRERFAVHLDVANMIFSPAQCYDTTALIHEAFDKLGAYIKSSHAKDLILYPQNHVHIDEIRPGLGVIDYRLFLQQLGRLEPDTPLLLERLGSDEDYALAAEYLRATARAVGTAL